MRIVLVCVGRLRGPPFADDAAHYQRLLRRHVRLEVREARDAATVERHLPKDSFVCVLDRQGEALSSEELARFIEERRSSGKNLCFVVGGPFGLEPSAGVQADKRLSFGPLTLPHQLARVVLLEQLFRAHKILAREPYHY